MVERMKFLMCLKECLLKKNYQIFGTHRPTDGHDKCEDASKAMKKGKHENMGPPNSHPFPIKNLFFATGTTISPLFSVFVLVCMLEYESVFSCACGVGGGM